MDIRKDSSRYEQYFVSDIEDGEWLQYTVHAKTSGKYFLKIYFGAIEKIGNISIMVNGKEIAKNLYLPATGGMKTWKSVELRNLQLTGKPDKIRIKVSQGGFNLKQLEFIKSASSKT